MKGFDKMLQEFYDRINLKSDLSLLSKMICQNIILVNTYLMKLF